MIFTFKETLRLIFRFINIFGFTCVFNFVLANETEKDIHDDHDGTFVDSKIVNREIVNGINNKNNDINNANSLNIVKNYCVNNFCDSFQIDACNNNIGHKTIDENYDSQEDNGCKSKKFRQLLKFFLRKSDCFF